MSFARFVLPALACVASAAVASSQKSNVGNVVQKIDVTFLKNQPEQTLGKPMLIEFWWTTSGPCKQSIPHLNELQKKYKDNGLVVIGVSDENADVIQDFAKQVPIEYALAHDKDSAFQKPFGIRGRPHILLVDKTGKITWEGHPLEIEDKDIEKLF